MTRVLFAVLFIGLVPSWAQVLRIRPAFQMGQTFTVEIKKEREDSRAARQTPGSSTVSTVRVLETSAKGTVLDWTPGATTFSDPEAAKNPIVASAANALQGLHFEVVLNSAGEYSGLRNEPAVQAEIRAAGDGIVANVLAGVPAAQRDQVKTVLAQLLTPATLMQGATREIQLIFQFGNIELKSGERIEKQVSSTSPTAGGGELKSKLVIAATKVDEKARLRTLEVTQDFEPISLQQGLGTAAPANAPAVQTKLNDKTTYSVDLERRRVTALQYQRTTIAGDGATTARRVDTTAVAIQW